MLKLETEADLVALHSGNIKESLTLEYKASPSVDKQDNNKKTEMARDVSAFANADGGQIVYGMTEKDHEPAGLDQGVDPKVYPEIWFEQVLQQHVTPPIAGLRIHHVPLSRGSVATVIDVPASKADPHQVSDGRYYRRHNFNRLVMEHYEVRDTFRRTTTPDLYVTLDFAMGIAPIIFPPLIEISKPIAINVSINNRSVQPAYHAHIQIGIDTDLPLAAANDFDPMGITGDQNQQYWLGHRISSPPDMPIFKEINPSVGHRFQILITYHSSQLGSEKLFDLTTSIQTPGQSSTEKWVVHHRAGSLRMCPPGHPLNPK